MPYTHEVRFEKVFTGGLLAGMTIKNECVRFPNLASAKAWIKQVLKQPKVERPVNGSSPYRIENPHVVAL